MRALVSSFAGLVLVLVAFGNAFAAEEEIISFHSEITIHEDATVTIVETILVRATGNKIRRGIYRDFPTVYKDRYGNTVRVGFEVLRALRDTDRVNHWVESIPGGKRVYMGSKDRFISPGQYAFQLTYKTDQQVSFYEDFDELAWNATGDQWDFPISKAVTEIHLPPGATVREKVVYTGRYGSKEQSAIAESASPRTVRFQSTRVLNPGEGMTVAVSWPKGFVKEPTVAQGFWLLLKANADLAAAVAGLIVVVAYYLIAWAYVGRDPKAGTIIPRFKPPGNMSPAVMRYILTRRLDDLTFCSAIVSLAVKGVLRIENDDSTYTLTKTSSDYSGLSKGELAVVKELFAGESRSISLQNGNHISFGLARNQLHAQLKSEVDDIYFRENRIYWLVGTVLSLIAVAIIFYFSRDKISEETVTNFALMAIIGVSAFTVRLASGSTASAASQTELIVRIVGRIGLPIGGLIFVNLIGLFASLSWFVIVIIGIHATLSPVFSFLLKAPTLQGRDILDQIHGFKQYLSVAEKNQLESMHPPKETPESFERFMPYAIALDVGHIWSQRFSDHLNSLDAMGNTVRYDYRPSWYRGRRWSRRSISGLGRNIGTAFSGAVSEAMTPPASTSRDSFTGDSDGFSSGGFSGGFGGGGFSGGGGGGGGGGGF